MTEDGDKKAVIARRLGVDASVVINHLALIDAPPCIEAVYMSGRSTSAKTIYELRSLHSKYPAKAEAWCESAEEVTRKTVSALATELKGGKKAGPTKDTDAEKTSGGDGAPENLGYVQDSPSGKTGGNGAGEGRSSPAPLTGAGAAGAGAANGAPPPAGWPGDEDRDLGELTSWPRGKAVSDPDLMKKPLLIVEVDGRPAAVLLNRKPTAAGLLRIRYEDGGADAEVAAADCRSTY